MTTFSANEARANFYRLMDQAAQTNGKIGGAILEPACRIELQRQPTQLTRRHRAFPNFVEIALEPGVLSDTV